MPRQRLLPLGFIDKTTEDGVTIMLTSPSDSHSIHPDTPVTLQNKSARGTPATARVRGLITAVGYVSAKFKVVETRSDPNWPDGEEILRRGTPVYQALPGGFDPDPARTITEKQAKDLGDLAARYRATMKPARPTPPNLPRPSENGLLPYQ